MRTLRMLVSAILAAGLLQLSAAPASAAPPGNDEPGGAVALKLGKTVEQDTSQATTNPQDGELGDICDTTEAKASVWYAYTPDVDRRVVLDVTASDYDVVVLVFVGKPSSDSLETCAYGEVGLIVSAGTTYTIMVVSASDVNGGELVLSLKEAPPPPRVRVAVAKRGLAYRNGDARVRGSYVCTRSDYSEVSGSLVQRVGRMKIPAWFYLEELRCDGRRHGWSERMSSDTGTYARGRARVEVAILACGMFECVEDGARRQVRLKRPAGR